MPFYEYACEACGHKFEKFVRSMSASYEIECPECHSRDCKKQFSTFGCSSSSSASAGGASCAHATAGGG